MNRIGGGIAVCNNQSAGFVECAPILLVGCITVHRIEHGCRIGIDITGLFAQIAVQILLHHGSRWLTVPGKINLLIRDSLPIQMLAQQSGLGCLAGTVGSFEYNQLSTHFRFFSCLTWTRNNGSFIMRPSRFGSLHRR